MCIYLFIARCVILKVTKIWQKYLSGPLNCHSLLITDGEEEDVDDEGEEWQPAEALDESDVKTVRRHAVNRFGKHLKNESRHLSAQWFSTFFAYSLKSRCDERFPHCIAISE